MSICQHRPPSSPSCCDLCGVVVAVGESTGAAEMELCGRCHVGDFGGRLAPRGLRTQSLSKRWYDEAGRAGGGGTRKIRGAIPYDLGLSASFSKEDWFSKVGKFFGKELEVGDREFDDSIYIRTDTPEELSKTLQNNGFREAVRYAVETTNNCFVLEKGTVLVETHDIEHSAMPAALRCVTLILHHLERWAVSLRLPYRPELATYPDLLHEIEYLNEAKGTLGDGRYWPKEFLIEESTIDHLEPVAYVHNMVAETRKPFDVLQLKHVHIISGNLAPLAVLSTLRVLELDRIQAANNLTPLAGLRSLEELTIEDSPVTDIRPLADLPRLRELKLRYLPLSDLSPLASLRSLRKLDLRGTKVVDVSPLARLPELELLWIQGLGVSDDQVRALRTANPGLDFDPY